MHYRNVELHNVEWARPHAGGVLLCRAPERIWETLRPGTRAAYCRSEGTEIRFAADWEPARVTLSCPEGSAEARLYYGMHQGEGFAIPAEPTEIEIPVPAFLPRAGCEGEPFAPAVRRLLLSGGPVCFYGASGRGVRPPCPEELPRRRYLAYGTSITEGSRATGPDLSFVAQTARRLGADALNKGANGQCFCEAAVADWLADRGDWDFATLCLSVNMLNQGATAEEFRERAAYLATAMAERNPGRPVVCIGLFPFLGDRGLRIPGRVYRAAPDEFRRILREIVARAALPNLHYVDGRELLSFAGLSQDCLHPGDFGMIEIAEKLSDFLRPRIAGRPQP